MTYQESGVAIEITSDSSSHQIEDSPFVLSEVKWSTCDLSTLNPRALSFEPNFLNPCAPPSLSHLNPRAEIFTPNLNLNTDLNIPQVISILNPKAKTFIKLSDDRNSLPPTDNQEMPDLELEGITTLENSVSLLDITPPLVDLATPNISFMSHSDHKEFPSSLLDLEVLSPNTFNVRDSITDHEDNLDRSLDNVFVDYRERGMYIFVFMVSLTIVLTLLSGPRKVSSDEKDPHTALQSLRLKNIDRIILGHLNVNSIRNKIDLLADMISNRVDILLISETKIDGSFPKSQFIIHGYSEPYRLDRTAFGGGLLLYVRNDIPSKELPLVEGNIECIFMEATISKKKWLFVGAYNPAKAAISKFLTVLEKSLNHYLLSYDNVVVLGDFNSEVQEEDLENFCESYDLKGWYSHMD